MFPFCILVNRRGCRHRFCDLLFIIKHTSKESTRLQVIVSRVLQMENTEGQFVGKKLYLDIQLQHMRAGSEGGSLFFSETFIIKIISHTSFTLRFGICLQSMGHVHLLSMQPGQEAAHGTV